MIDPSRVLSATQTLDEYAFSAYDDEAYIEERIRTDLIVSLVREIPLDAHDLSITFYPKEPAWYGNIRWFATARVDRVKELEEEVEGLRARVRVLEFNRMGFEG